jgi:hypothetical protein
MPVEGAAEPSNNHWLPIVSGTDGFAGISGVVQFTDDVTTGLSP